MTVIRDGASAVDDLHGAMAAAAASASKSCSRAGDLLSVAGV